MSLHLWKIPRTLQDNIHRLMQDMFVEKHDVLQKSSPDDVQWPEAPPTVQADKSGGNGKMTPIPTKPMFQRTTCLELDACFLFINPKNTTRKEINGFNSKNLWWSTQFIQLMTTAFHHCCHANGKPMGAENCFILQCLNPCHITNQARAITVTHFDGLGRPIQQVSSRAGGQELNIVRHFECDFLGRQAKEFLPHVNQGQSTGETSMNCKSTHAVHTVLPHCRENKCLDDFSNVANPFSEKSLEASPRS